jgi:lipopolysaccharide export system ATP-binding protein
VVLHASDLVKVYGQRPVVNGVEFVVNPGEVVGLLGPNGAGKTTSFYMVVGMVNPTRGEVMLDGRNIAHLPIHERARLGLGYLPQETSVFRKLTVEENLKLVLEFQPLSPKQQRDRMNTLLEEFGLTRVRHSVAIQLSGGERRRVEIARAIATNPKYLLLDEPFTGIDPIAIQDIQQLIRGLKDKGLGVLLTDHNPMATLSIVDTANIIVDGKVIFSGDSATVAANPMVRQYYLGDDFTL